MALLNEARVSAAANETSLLSLLHSHAARTPDQPAVLAPDRRTASYAQLLEQVRSVGARLEQVGITDGSSVALALPNGPDLAVAFLATAARATCAPLQPERPRAEHERDLATLGANALIVARDHDTAARDAATALAIPVFELVPDDIAGSFVLMDESAAVEGVAAETARAGQSDDAALLLFTSGTTSAPKLVSLAEASLLRSAATIAATLRLEPDDRCLNVMPLFHVHGLVAALLASITAGGSVVCTPGFNASDVWAWINELQPTWYTAVPTIHQAMLEASQRRVADQQPIPSPLRFARSSSAALPTRLQADLGAVLGVPVIEAYGMTEAAHQIASNPLPPVESKPGTVGLPTGCEVAVMDEDGHILPANSVGEIVVRGPSLATGYVGNPDATAAAFRDGWFHTGDQGRIDNDGYVALTGRLKEMINRGGEKISPREVDDALLAHQDVVHAVAFGFPHSRLGEDVGAAVVLREEAHVTAPQLRVFVAETLASYKVPRRIVVVDEIPRGATGKFDRAHVAARLGVADRPTEQRMRSEPVPPADETERTLAEIWQRVLGDDEPPSMDDDFFALGGDSLHVTELSEAVETAFGQRLPATVFFTDTTVREMADVLRTDAPASTEPAVVHVQPNGSRPPLFCLMRAGSVVTLRHFAATLGPDQPIFGLWIPAMHGSREQAGTIEEIAEIAANLVVGVRPDGPYFFFGHSLGGLVIFETARQLAARGQRVGLIVIADSFHPDVLRAEWVRRHSLRYRLRKILRGKGPKIIAWRVRQLFGRNPPKPVQYLPGTNMTVDWRTAMERERQYHPGPAPGPVVIFATDVYVRAAKDPDLGWAPVLGAGSEIVIVPGNHDTMIGEPHVHVVATRLEDCLARARADLLNADVE